MEVLISISILTILLGTGLSIGKFGNMLKDDISYTSDVYEIQNLLSYGKAVCKYKKQNGKITVESKKNKITFIEGFDNIEKVVYLSENIKIISNDINLAITEDGKITRGTTLMLLDKHRERRAISIVVGVDQINIKNGEFI